MSRCHCHHHHEAETAPRKRRSLIGMLVQLVVLYVALVFGGGTLINTGHPVAVETGRLIHTVTFVDPAIRWADGRGFDPLVTGLRVLSSGFPVGAFS